MAMFIQFVDPKKLTHGRHSPVGESGAVLISGSKESSAKTCKNHWTLENGILYPLVN